MKRDSLAAVGAWGVPKKPFVIFFEIVRFDAMLIQMKYGIFILCLAQSAYSADIVSDVVYESPGCTDPTLNIYLPESGLLSGTPTYLFIHGGGWASGDKAQNDELHVALADAGYAVVSCNYTLSSAKTASYPQAIHDTKAVVKWIREDGAEYGLSPTIIGGGGSAGGHLTEMLLTTAGVGMFEPLPPPVGGYRINGAIPFWGLSDFVMQIEHFGFNLMFMWFFGEPYNPKTAPLYQEGSPINYADASDPPAHFVHGLSDPIHAWQQSENIHLLLGTFGVYSTTEYFNGGHGWNAYKQVADPTATVTMHIPLLLQADRTADINRDGLVNTSDILELISAWGNCPDLPVDCPADIDANGIVNATDLLTIIENWG